MVTLSLKSKIHIMYNGYTSDCKCTTSVTIFTTFMIIYIEKSKLLYCFYIHCYLYRTNPHRGYRTPHRGDCVVRRGAAGYGLHMHHQGQVSEAHNTPHTERGIPGSNNFIQFLIIKKTFTLLICAQQY